MQRENSRPRRYKAALPRITDDLKKYHLSIFDIVEYVFTKQAENQILLQSFLDELPQLLKFISRHAHSTGLIADFCHNHVIPIYQSELEQLMAKKDIYRLPLKHATSPQVLSFSADTMARDMESTATRVWSLLGHLLESNKRQRQRRNLIRKKLQELDSNASAEEADAEDDRDASSSSDTDDSDDSDDERGEMSTSDNSTKGTKKMKRRIDKFDALTRVKQQAIISICLHQSTSRCNAYQAINALAFHANGTPDLVVQSLAHVGLSVSKRSTGRLIKALSNHQDEIIHLWTFKRCLSIAYDNFDMGFNTNEPSFDNPAFFWNATNATYMRMNHTNPSDLECSDELWKDNTLNLYREVDPPPLEWHRLRPTFQRRDGDDHSPLVLLIAWHLREALVTAPAFEDSGYHRKLGKPEPRKKIPVVKTEQMPARAMDIKQSTNDGQAQVLARLLETAGLGDTDEPGDSNTGRKSVRSLGNRVLLVHGDLSTYERLLACVKYRSIENTPSRRLQYVIFVIGIFHLLMAGTDAIYRALILPVESRLAEDSLFKHVGILRPRETGKFTSGKGPSFRAMHDVIFQDSKACYRDCWRVELEERFPNIRSLQDYVSISPRWEDIEKILIEMAYKYFTLHPSSFREKRKPMEQRDLMFENSQLKHTLFFMYLELAKASNEGDIGRVEDIMFHWIVVFQAVGKHKYASLLTRFLLDLRFRYPEGLREAIRMNWLCNPSGKEGRFRAIDWLVEINNCDTKVVFSGGSSNKTKEMVLKQSNLIDVFRTARQNMGKHYHLSSLTSRHKRPDMTHTLEQLSDMLQRVNPNKKIPGRTSRYIIPDLFQVGLEELHKIQSEVVNTTHQSAATDPGEAAVNNATEQNTDGDELAAQDGISDTDYVVDYEEETGDIEREDIEAIFDFDE